MDFAVLAAPRVKIKAKRNEPEVLRPCRITKKATNMRVTVDAIIIRVLGMIPKSLERGLKELEIRGRDHQDYSIVVISQKTGKSPLHLRRLAVTHTQVKDLPVSASAKNLHNKKNIRQDMTGYRR